MPNHGREMLAITNLMSSIHSGPQELRRLRFEADEGLTSQEEADEGIDRERQRRWMDGNTRIERESHHHNVFHENPPRAHSRYDDVYRPGCGETEELRPWMKMRIDALQKELKDAINMEGKRERWGMKGIDDDDQCNAGCDCGDLKAWMMEELEQVKEELQDGVIEGRCRCTGNEANGGTGGAEEGERSPRTIGDQGRSSAASAEAAVGKAFGEGKKRQSVVTQSDTPSNQSDPAPKLG